MLFIQIIIIYIIFLYKVRSNPYKLPWAVFSEFAFETTKNLSLIIFLVPIGLVEISTKISNFTSS